jgi:16S rRNA (cytosine1402-N4)-methyltransferase
VDATVGLGGHAAALLAAAPGLRLLGLDRDPEALRIAAERLRPFGPRVRLVNRPFAELPAILHEIGESPAAVLADLGCSSLQFDTPERGFSLRADGPLDMRFGPTGPTAADLLNRVSEEELMDILWSYGEERRARAIAGALIRRRQRRPLETTAELVEVVVEVLGPMRRGRVHPATRTMQAIRIAVNDELSQLESFLRRRPSAAPGRL